MTRRVGVEGRTREPAWSGRLTDGLAARVPDARRPMALAMIKAIHTVIFFSIAALVLVVAWDGLRGRPRCRTAIAASVAVAESAVYGGNNLVCPLAPLAEELGAERGTVTDIFLPDAISRLIPAVAGTALGVGIVLSVRASRAARATSI